MIINGHLAPRPLLAIDGGTPIRSAFLPFGTPCFGEEEIDEIVATLRSGWIGPGPKVERFEQEFAAYIGSPHAMAVNSCTSGLFLSLLALGIGKGDEVITTPLTFAATANVVEHTGAKLVLADIDPETLNLDPEKVVAAITPKTRAIIPVHFGGRACEMSALQTVADRHGLVVLEDAAHAVGTRYHGRMAGTFGKLGAFSFYANKNLTTAEGGMVATRDSQLADTIRLLRLHGLSRDAWKRYSSRRILKVDVLLPGYKCNMTDMAASLGLHQLRKLESFLRLREKYAAIYDEAFGDLAVDRQHRPAPSTTDRHSLHLYCLILKPDAWRVSRDRVVEALLSENIGAVIHYQPVHMLTYYRQKYGFQPSDFPIAVDIASRILSLPLTPAMCERDVLDVVKAVQRVSEAYLI